MNKIKSIRTEEDYREALELLESLIDLNPEPDTDESDQLDILSILIEKYEEERIPQNSPSALETIEFFMDQKDLRPVDLVPYLGSKSRVSEILSGKRSLTVEMIRALEEGLGIPSSLLLVKPAPTEDSMLDSWDSKLFVEMSKRGYFAKLKSNMASRSEQLKAFLESAPLNMPAPVLLRQSEYRTSPITDRNALIAWSIRVLFLAKEKKDIADYIEGSVDLAYMREIANLSVHDDGPVRAVESLRAKGIAVVIEPHLPKTRLDGAVLELNKKPVIGLTLRHDRLDNFWFVLMHELSHISLHFGKSETDSYYDELDAIKGLEVASQEKEADSLASEGLVPSEIWSVSPARLIPSPLAAKSLANEVGVDVAVIAGKIRYENGNWNYLNKLVSEKTVRHLFPVGDRQ